LTKTYLGPPNDLEEAFFFGLEIGPEPLQITELSLGFLAIFVPSVELESQKYPDDNHHHIKRNGDPVFGRENVFGIDGAT